jgi:hypothetical protein
MLPDNAIASVKQNWGVGRSVMASRLLRAERRLSKVRKADIAELTEAEELLGFRYNASA